MIAWHTIFHLIPSLSIRLMLEGITGLAQAENLFLIWLFRFKTLSWPIFITIPIVLLTFAFWQMNHDYSTSVQDANSATTLLAAKSSSWTRMRFKLKSSKIRVSGSHSAQEPQTSDQDHDIWTKEFHGRVTMFPCQLQHRRISSFKDHYVHSYLYVGCPVGLSASYNPLIVVEPKYCPWYRLPWKKAWFSIRPRDHAFNGGADLSMAQKLEEFLESEGEDPAEWPYAYILTPPSVTRQLNNPLAFWYLYNRKRHLTAMIVQLQTSYGERRLWLTRNCRAGPSTPGPYCFQGKFEKDLQVSPFTPLSSPLTPLSTSYTIDSSDPSLAPLDELKIKVTLEQGAKTIMYATVSPAGAPLDASTASLSSSLIFLVKWWWVPMCSVVVFRILSKAARIYVTHSKIELNIQTRTEPIKTAIAKPARLSERRLENFFFLLLSSVVRSQSRIKSVKYITSGDHCERVRIIESYQEASDLGDRNHEAGPGGSIPGLCDQITFQVNTPGFYSRFFHYRSPFDAIQRELLDDERTRTAWSSHPYDFLSLFPQEKERIRRKPLDWRWRIISLLRTPPLKTNFPRQVAYKPFRGMSLTDSLLFENCSSGQFRKYRRSLFRLFLGHWMGGFSIGPILEGDFELIGLSRDAILVIQDAAFKSGLVILAMYLTERRETEAARIFCSPIAALLVAGLNTWACLKAVI